MNKDPNEIVSVVMDGDLSTVQHADHIHEIMHNDELRQKWHRYHLIRDVLQGHLVQDVDSELSTRITRALEDEPAILSPWVSKKSRFLKPVAGLAIAASVTAAVLLGVQVNNKQTVPDTTPAFASNTTPQVSQPVQFVSGNSRSNTSATATSAGESPINRYLVNYNEFRANSGVRGMLPYVRIVGHETNE